RKNGDTLAVIALVLAIAESLDSGVLRKLVGYLRDLAIPEEEILRLRLDEPEHVSEMLRVEKIIADTRATRTKDGVLSMEHDLTIVTNTEDAVSVKAEIEIAALGPPPYLNFPESFEGKLLVSPEVISDLQFGRQ